MRETLPPSPMTDADGGADFCLLVCLATGVRSIPLRVGRRYTLGRGPGHDIVLADSSVSRDHAVLHMEGSPAIEDTGSRNGTRVGGQRVPPSHRVPLAAGASVEIGNVSLFLHRGPLPTMDDGHTPDLGGLILQDPAMIELLRLAEAVAQSDLRVLILGETGVGKELLAQAVHGFSPRHAAPLVRLNCCAFPEALLESELFGHERGAFTGAVQVKTGLFQSAEGGTLFLDEVGELPLTMQAKLLRVLETREVTRLGAVKPTTVDVRFIAATNRDLKEMIAQQRFRADLFFRLNGMALTIPPLRKRRAEIAPLALHFARRFAAELGRPRPEFTEEATAHLESHTWPGNVRELKSVIERAVLLADGSLLEPESFTIDTDTAPESSPPPTSRLSDSGSRNAWPAEITRAFSGTIPERGPTPDEIRAEAMRTERQQIIDALERAVTQAEAAKLLGISRRTLINRLEEYEIARPRKRK